LSLVTSTPTRIQEATHGLLGVRAADADDERDDAGMPRRDFVKRRGFFFQGEADEGHFSGDLI